MQKEQLGKGIYSCACTLFEKKATVYFASHNHLSQCFISNKPNDIWVSDITYIRTSEGWLFLAVIIDLFSRKIIGHSTGHRQTTPLIIDALQMASQRLNKNSKVILHSDLSIALINMYSLLESIILF